MFLRLNQGSLSAAGLVDMGRLGTDLAEERGPSGRVGGLRPREQSREACVCRAGGQRAGWAWLAHLESSGRRAQLPWSERGASARPCKAPAPTDFRLCCGTASRSPYRSVSMTAARVCSGSGRGFVPGNLPRAAPGGPAPARGCGSVFRRVQKPALQCERF